MKIAVLSDIHGNYIALKECIEYSIKNNVERFIFLGDYLGELPYPQKTLKIIRKLQDDFICDFVRGNKEDYWLNYRKNGQQGWSENDSTTGSLLYTYRNLKDTDLDFFESLSCSKRIIISNMLQITICHGSPRKVNDKMGKNEYTYKIMEVDCSELILYGHTHIQEIITHNYKKVLNPGAVGVPLNSAGKTQFLILNAVNEKWEEEFISLNYDIESAIDDIHQSGLYRMAPYWAEVTIHLLKTGKVSHGSVLSRAMEICRTEESHCNWPNIAEKYWQQAVNEMIG